MRRLLIVLFAVIVVLLVIADRVLAAVAGHVVASKIRDDESLSSTPDVTIHGVPFLTQAFGGDYSDVTVVAKDVRRDGVTISRLSADLYDVHLGLSAALHGNVSSVPVDRTVATVTEEYGDLDSYLSSKHLTVTYAGGDQVKVSGPVSLAGQSLQASGTGKVSLSSNRIEVTLQTATVAGVSSSAAAGLLAFSVPLTGLPFGISLTAVTVSSAGVSLQGHSGRIVLGHAGG